MKFRIVRRLRNGSTVDVALPAMGSDALTISAPSKDVALERARTLGLYGVTALEADEDGRIAAEKVSN